MAKSTKEVLEKKVVKQQETEILEPIRAEVEEIQGQETEPKEVETQGDLKQEAEPTNVIDWSALKATKSKATEKISGEEGICTIVNCKKNGNKRISVASKLFEAIGNPKEVEVGIMPNGIVISEKLPIEAHVFSVKKLGAKKVIYAGALVEEITEEFKLDYSNRTSITFQKVKYDNVNGYQVALIIIQ